MLPKCTCFNILSNNIYSLPAIAVICRSPIFTVTTSNLGGGGSLPILPIILVFLIGIDLVVVIFVILLLVVLKRPLFTRGCDADGPCGRRQGGRRHGQCQGELHTGTFTTRSMLMSQVDLQQLASHRAIGDCRFTF